MSIHLMSLVWEVKFPTLTQKCVLLKLADHATDDGDSVFPANETLAYQIGCDKRSIQRSIKALAGAGILTQKRAGGRGHGDTNHWQIDVDKLIDLAVGDLVLVSIDGELKAVENEGDSLPPSATSRVTKLLSRVTRVSRKGDTGVTQTTNNHQIEPSGASADAREGSRTAPLGNRPAIVITPRSDKSNWAAWINLLSKEEKTGLIAAAERDGRMVVTSKWPNSEEGLRGLLEPKLADHTQRMLGEDAA